MRKYIIIAVLIISMTAIIADWPSAGPYVLRWGAVTNGGTETEMRESASGYRLSDNLGSNSYVADSFLTDGTTYINRPGYRKVEWDERKPITSVDPFEEDTISSAPNFVVTWGGADTTIEDGIGWGLRHFDIQYRINSGAWQDWHVGTPLTSDNFGPFAPVAVFEDTTYYFRCRATDKAGNIEDWPATWEAWARYEEQVLNWVVVNEADSNDWSIGYDVALSSTATMATGEEFIVKNEGDVTIDIGIKGYPTTGWDLEGTPGVNRYAVKGIFNDDATPPSTFGAEDTVTANEFIYATDLIYGSGGYNIQGRTASPAPDSSEFTENLWLQLQTPTAVSVWSDSQVIRLDLKATPSVP